MVIEQFYTLREFKKGYSYSLRYQRNLFQKRYKFIYCNIKDYFYIMLLKFFTLTFLMRLLYAPFQLGNHNNNLKNNTFPIYRKFLLIIIGHSFIMLNWNFSMKFYWNFSMKFLDFIIFTFIIFFLWLLFSWLLFLYNFCFYKMVKNDNNVTGIFCKLLQNSKCQNTVDR